MDPTACMRELIEAIVCNYKDEALQHIVNFAEWSRKGGHAPDWNAIRAECLYHLTNLDEQDNS